MVVTKMEIVCPKLMPNLAVTMAHSTATSTQHYELTMKAKQV